MQQAAGVWHNYMTTFLAVPAWHSPIKSRGKEKEESSLPLSYSTTHTSPLDSTGDNSHSPLHDPLFLFSSSFHLAR